MVRQKINSENYIFTYEGEEHLIDLETLLVTQMNLSGAINEITRQLYPDINPKLKVSTISPGSFELHQVFEYSFLERLFTKENLGILANVFGVIGGFATLVAFLKGRRADKTQRQGDTIILIVKDTQLEVDVRIWEMFTTNAVVSECLKRAFTKAQEDDSIQGVHVIQEGNPEPILQVPRENFGAYTQPNPYLDSAVRTLTHERVMLRIKKIDFRPTGNSKSSFYFNGRKIDAVIKDVAFLVQLEKGLKLGLGDGLLVDLLIHQKYEDTYQTFVELNKNEIVRVHETDIRPYNEQSELGLQ